MKLSDAIVLGDSLKKPENYTFLLLDKSGGCALGGALLAVGKAEEYLRSGLSAPEFLPQVWPWLTGRVIDAIGGRYIYYGLENVVEYVKSVELKEVQSGEETSGVNSGETEVLDAGRVVESLV